MGKWMNELVVPFLLALTVRSGVQMLTFCTLTWTELSFGHWSAVQWGQVSSSGLDEHQLPFTQGASMGRREGVQRVWEGCLQLMLGGFLGQWGSLCLTYQECLTRPYNPSGLRCSFGLTGCPEALAGTLRRWDCAHWDLNKWRRGVGCRRAWSTACACAWVRRRRGLRGGVRSKVGPRLWRAWVSEWGSEDFSFRDFF